MHPYFTLDSVLKSAKCRVLFRLLLFLLEGDCIKLCFLLAGEELPPINLLLLVFVLLLLVVNIKLGLPTFKEDLEFWLAKLDALLFF